MTLPIKVGTLQPGPLNAITDVAGARVGHVTLIHDEPRVARTGVTAIHPLDVPYWEANVFAGFHRLNGFGEVTGTHWIAETGILTSPILLTSTYSLGLVRDTMLAHPYQMIGDHLRFHVPVCAETNDFYLNDGLAHHVRAHHVLEALDAASSGPVAQGNVGGGTGMMSFGFKSGIGTASRLADTASGTYRVGVLVQSNFGARARLTIDGVPVGGFITPAEVPTPQFSLGGSIIVVVATDAPLIPSQCERLAQRAVIGLGRVGCYGSNTSGDFVIAFSTATRLPPVPDTAPAVASMMPNMHMTPLFHAVAEATEAAVVNALAYSEMMSGHLGHVVHRMPLDRVEEILGRARAAG